MATTNLKYSMNYSGDIHILALKNDNFEVQFNYPPYNEEDKKSIELTKEELTNLRKCINHFIDFRMV